MKKSRKRLLVVAASVVVVLLGGWWMLQRSLHALVKSRIESVGTQAAGTPVTLERVDLSLWSGRGEITGFAIANPDGFDTEHAFRLGRVGIHLDVGSLRSGVVVVHEVVIDGAHLLAEQRRRNNLLTILRSARAFADDDEPARWPARFVIERFTFTNARLTVHVPLLPDQHVDLPDLDVTDIGAGAEGVAVPEVPLRMLEPVIEAALRAARRRVPGFP